MTTLISWFGRDSHGPASVYIASDSRVSWPNGAAWDRARKVFASQRYAEIFGYCGDAFFPSQLLGQAIELLDRNLLFDPGETSLTKLERLRAFLARGLETYTDRLRLGFRLVYASRDGEGMKCTFSVYRLFFAAGDWTQDGPMPLGEKSGLLVNLGSGSNSVAAHVERWSSSLVGGTSRSIFGAFSDSLESAGDPSSGGPPQLVGLYRKGPARVFGIVTNGQPFVLGSEPATTGDTALEWRNSLFERCDPATLRLLAGAQRQPRPRQL